MLSGDQFPRNDWRVGQLMPVASRRSPRGAKVRSTSSVGTQNLDLVLEIRVRSWDAWQSPEKLHLPGKSRRTSAVNSGYQIRRRLLTLFSRIEVRRTNSEFEKKSPQVVCHKCLMTLAIQMGWRVQRELNIGRILINFWFNCLHPFARCYIVDASVIDELRASFSELCRVGFGAHGQEHGVMSLGSCAGRQVFWHKDQP